MPPKRTRDNRVWTKWLRFAKRPVMRNLRSQLISWQARVAAQLARRTPSESTFLILLPVVGVTVGLITVGTANIIAFIQKLFWGSGTNIITAAAEKAKITQK